MRTTLIIVGLGLVLLVGGSWWSRSLQAKDPNVIATNGLHWHAHLVIEVGTTTVAIPAGIGLGAAEMAIHTHDATGEIHMECGGVVHKKDLTLGQFFKVWGKDINSFGTNMRMTVNGTPNTEYGAYEMHDGDNIVLIYD